VCCPSAQNPGHSKKFWWPANSTLGGGQSSRPKAVLFQLQLQHMLAGLLCAIWAITARIASAEARAAGMPLCNGDGGNYAAINWTGIGAIRKADWVFYLNNYKNIFDRKCLISQVKTLVSPGIRLKRQDDPPIPIPSAGSPRFLPPLIKSPKGKKPPVATVGLRATSSVVLLPPSAWVCFWDLFPKKVFRIS